MLFTSSDKAVNPTNVMGTSKLMGERLMTAANALRPGVRTRFASTRFGNVLGSRGSVIPLFQRQIAAGGPVTLTDPDMTRFIMTLEQSVRLVMDSPFLARGGEVFVTKMPIARIADLADVMIEELAPRYGHDATAVEQRVVGLRPGEKMYEELMNDEETRRAVDTRRLLRRRCRRPCRSTLGAWPIAYGSAAPVERPYNSREETAMSRDELAAYMQEHGLLTTLERRHVTMKILVLGGDGYLGWPTAMRFAAEGHEVRGGRQLPAAPASPSRPSPRR